jgi:MYXO-CTERM domain-containing protein
MHSRRVVVAVAVLVALPSAASAHFHLDAPASAYEQTAQGDPQKAFPCGPTTTSGVATDDVTTVVAGGTLTVTITETIFHPGHYRIALTPDEASLPAEPLVTPGTTECGSVPIDDAPALPVLADGVLVHTSRFNGPQTVEIAIPADATCTGCVVQVLEFMSSHGAPCFYHHCARVDVLPAGSMLPDAGTPQPEPDNGGGGCQATRSTGLLPLLALGLLFARRRRGSLRPDHELQAPW